MVITDAAQMSKILLTFARLDTKFKSIGCKKYKTDKPRLNSVCTPNKNRKSYSAKVKAFISMYTNQSSQK